MEGSSSSSSMAAPPSKPVIVRVKRKSFHSPLHAFWLEINERPLKRPLLDFQNLSVSSESAQKAEFHNKKVFMQHVETISSSEVTRDIVQSFVDPGSSGASESKSKIDERKNLFKKDNKQDQLSRAKQQKESFAKDARFEQIWKSRRGNKGAEHENALQDICHFYDIVRVDKMQQEDISLEDQNLLSSFLPLLKEVIPDAATEIEADLANSKKDDYVYDLYTVNDEMDMDVDDTSYSLPLVQVDEDDYYDGPDDSEYETDDSNDENNPLNDYPDELTEDEEEGSESENSNASKESSDEDNEEHGFSRDNEADPLYDEDFDNYDGRVGYDVDDDDEDWKWSHR
ncbi:hypothetical protein TanjilG_20872 [Lupinus angustifolius]|uniref:Uncharacterized protein n=1 Tax=Lupinus angustifolius TaxID=3871 RepID=A0A1J7I737_LUPAN|nr:PREDICTED: RNA-directed DNA methylation 4 [Lupinus angustifolius]OIW14426.1 hypothetical protein TanjilG_20872 [Lupinus angustifolius]